MTMTSNNSVQIVAITSSAAEVRLCAGRDVMRIGDVGSSNGRWYWQHRDGEQSSPVGANPSEAAYALVSYHQAFKLRPASAASARRLLFD